MAYEISKLSNSQAASLTTERCCGWSEDKDGNMYVAFANQGIWKIGLDGTFSKIVGGVAVYDMAHLPDAMGYIYFRDTSNNLCKFHPSNPKNYAIVEASISDMNTIAVHPKRRETIYYTKYTSGQILEKTDKGSSSVVATGGGYTFHEMYTDGTYLWIPLYSTQVQVWTINGWGNTTINSVNGNPSGVGPYKGNTVLITRDDDGQIVRVTNSAILSAPLYTTPQRGYAITYSPRRGTIFVGGSQSGAGNQNYAADYRTVVAPKPTMIRSLAGVGSIAYTQSVSDSVTVSDVIKKSWTRIISESTTIGEAIASSKVQFKAIADSITASDTIATLKGQFKTITESITIGEAIVKAATRRIAESTTIGEAVNGTKVTLAAVTDGITLSDAMAYQRGYYTSIVEAITLSDSKIIAAARIIAESVTISETITKTRTYIKAIADSITLADVVATTAVRAVRIIESITVTASLSVLKNGIPVSLRFFKKYAAKVVSFAKKYTGNPN